MQLSRRTLLGGLAVAGAATAVPGLGVMAQEGTPEAVEPVGTPAPVEEVEAPGYAIARVRVLPSDELHQALYPHIMSTFLPATRAIAGYEGYLLAFHDSVPGGSLTMTFLDDEAAAGEADAVARDFVGGFDPRFVTETPLAASGPVRIYRPTDRPLTELPPFLHGCWITMRERQNAPDADMDDVVARASAGLVPMLSEMPGFVLYCWILTDGGRLAVNIWETREQIDTGNQAIADWVAENTAPTTVGDPVVNTGQIAFSELPDLSG
jgi:hypothetical protein